MSMRTEKTEKRYRAAIAAGKLRKLYDETPIVDFKYWRVVKNRWPHDKIAPTNHMIVLKRECASLRNIKMYEWYDLLALVWQIRGDYDTFTYNLPSMSSVKDIPHVHLYRLKPELK